MTSAFPAPSSRTTRAASWLTRPEARPTATFPLVLTALTVSVLAMSIDAVPRYSTDAFIAGSLLTVVLAVVVGKVANGLAGSRFRPVATLLFPTVFGAFIGMVVQAIVLVDVGSSWSAAVRDLGGLVDTTEPVTWIAGGIVLGGVPAIAVALFLTLASRAVRRLGGHDAFEGFNVAFTGFAGVTAGFGTVVVDGIAVAPLFLVLTASALTMLIAFVTDGGRLRFLRAVYAGREKGFDVASAEHFVNDSSLAPLVTNGDRSAVLVHQAEVGYRATAAQPIAFLAATEQETLRPLLRRRFASAALFTAMLLFVGLSALSHVEVTRDYGRTSALAP